MLYNVFIILTCQAEVNIQSILLLSFFRKEVWKTRSATKKSML